MPIHKCWLAGGLALLVGLVAGCEGWGKRDIGPEPRPEPYKPANVLLEDTVGAYAVIGTAYAQHLRGYGLVVGLGDNGGSDCPTIIRDYLIDYLGRRASARAPRRERIKFSPRKLIDSLDTAVVVVHGLVPPGAPQGTVFDLQLQAVGTQTRSLAGGVLIPCELRRYDATAVGKELVTGPALALGAGLIYTTPRLTGQPAEAHDPRRGFVLGGGRTVETRTVRLLLREPSYWMARRIERRINERFGQYPKTADAVSKGYLELTTPAAYADRPMHFVDLATHLYLENTPQHVEAKLMQIAQHLDEGEESLKHISLIWEGIGRAVLPHIQPLYVHGDAGVRFYAARAGIRLRDAGAVGPLAQTAADPRDPHRLEAITELGRCSYPQAARPLVELLDDADTVVRVAAYEALRRHQHPALQTMRFTSPIDPTRDNLVLDVLKSHGPPMIYVHTAHEPRIAVFGAETPLIVPLFYSHPEDWVILNAPQADGDVSVLWRTRSGRRVSEPIIIAPRVADLVRVLADAPRPGPDGQLRGIGLDYSLIIEVLDNLCSSGVIPADLLMQETLMQDLLAPPERPERPEADESLPAEPNTPPADAGDAQ